MPISDGQIALGVMQLVGLSLPVFAILAQVYFAMTEERPSFIIGLILFFGGGSLVIGALISANYLWEVTDSSLISSSLQWVSIGLASIGGILFFIYSSSKSEIRELKELNQAHHELSSTLVDLMEEYEVRSVQELREEGVDVPDDIRGQATLEELKKVKRTSKELATGVDDIEQDLPENSLKRGLKSFPWSILNKRILITSAVIAAILLLSVFSPINMTSPIGVVFVALMSGIIPEILGRMGV